MHKHTGIDDKAAYACLAVIIFIGLALAAFFYSGPLYQMDDGSLISIAKSMLDGNFNILSNTFAFSYLPSALIYLSFMVFGVNTFSTILPSVLEYVALIVLAFLVGKTLFNNEVGLLSGILIITMPNVLGFVTRVVPDMLLGVLAGLIMYVLAQSIKHNERAPRLCFSAGLICGLMVFVKFGGVGLAIPIIIAMLMFNRKLVIPFVTGLALSLLVYTLSFYMLSGWKTSIFSAIEEYSQGQIGLTESNLMVNYVTMLDVITGPVFALQILPFGLILLFILVSTYITFKNRDNCLAYPASMFWFTFFYLFFGTESLHGYVSITVVTRYFLLVSVPMALLAAYLLFDMYVVSLRLRGKRIALGVLVLLLALILISNIPAYTAVYTYKLYILRSYVSLLWCSSAIRCADGGVFTSLILKRLHSLSWWI